MCLLCFYAVFRHANVLVGCTSLCALNVPYPRICVVTVHSQRVLWNCSEVNVGDSVQELLFIGCTSDSANFFLPIIQKKAWMSDVIKFIPILDFFLKACSTCNFHFKLFVSSYDKSSTAIIITMQQFWSNKWLCQTVSLAHSEYHAVNCHFNDENHFKMEILKLFIWLLYHCKWFLHGDW